MKQKYKVGVMNPWFFLLSLCVIALVAVGGSLVFMVGV